MAVQNVKITLYNITKKSNSTKQPTGGTEITGQLIDPFSLSSLSVKFKFNNTTWAMPNYNYAKIDKLGNRYYWVTWSYQKGFWIGSFEEDYLASHRDAIGNSTQYVVRADYSFRNQQILDTNRVTTVGKEMKRSDFVPWPVEYGDGDIRNYYWTAINQDVQKRDTPVSWYTWKYPNVVLILNIEAVQYFTPGSQPLPYMDVDEAYTIVRTNYVTYDRLLRKMSEKVGVDVASKTVVGAYFCPCTDYDFDKHEDDRIVAIRVGNLNKIEEWVTDDGNIPLDENMTSTHGFTYIINDAVQTYDYMVNIPTRSTYTEEWMYSNTGRSMFLVGGPFGKTQLDADIFLGTAVNAIKLRFVVEQFSGNAKVYLSPYHKEGISYTPISGKDDQFFTTVCLYAPLPMVLRGTENVAQARLNTIISGVQLGATAISMISPAAGAVVGGIASAAGSQLRLNQARGDRYFAAQAAGKAEEAFKAKSSVANAQTLMKTDAALKQANINFADALAAYGENAAGNGISAGGMLAISSVAGALSTISNANRVTTVQSTSIGDINMGDKPITLQCEDSLFGQAANEQLGFPCCTFHKIDDLKKTSDANSYGYVQCESPIVPTTGMTMDENAVIKNAMAQGFYYE